MIIKTLDPIGQVVTHPTGSQIYYLCKVDEQTVEDNSLQDDVIPDTRDILINLPVQWEEGVLYTPGQEVHFEDKFFKVEKEHKASNENKPADPDLHSEIVKEDLLNQM